MVKFLKFLFVSSIIGVMVYFGLKYYNSYKEEKRLAEIKEGWYVEITADELPVRDAADRYDGYKKGTVKKGEIYKVLDFEENDYYWYKIEWEGGWGWIAQIKKNGSNLIAYNQTIDLATPTLSFTSNTYSVVSINDINTKHLTLWDDQDDYTVTYIVCHEYPSNQNGYLNQYWVKWTITDKAGKYSSKIQRLYLEVTPDEEDVYEFYEYCQK